MNKQDKQAKKKAIVMEIDIKKNKKKYLSMYVVHSISFQTFLYRHLKLS